MTTASGPSPFEKLFILDCATVCGAKAQQSGRTEAYGKTKRETAQALSTYVRANRAGTRREFPGVAGKILLAAMVLFFAWAIWFLGGIATAIAQSMGFGVPAQLHYVYYEWADAHGLIVAALFLSVIPLCWMIVTGGKGILARADVVLANDTRARSCCCGLSSKSGLPKRVRRNSANRPRSNHSSIMPSPASDPSLPSASRAKRSTFVAPREPTMRGRSGAMLSSISWTPPASWSSLSATARPRLGGRPARGARSPWQDHYHYPARSGRGRPWCVLVDARENVVAIYHVADSTVVAWSSVPLKDNDFSEVMRLALYGRYCHGQA